MSEVVLSCQGLVKRFGGITATNDVTLNLRRGARHALIGPNGAGKTTLINLPCTGMPMAMARSRLSRIASSVAPKGEWTMRRATRNSSNSTVSE